jgi:hypothetical protein
MDQANALGWVLVICTFALVRMSKWYETGSRMRSFLLYAAIILGVGNLVTMIAFVFGRER